MINIKDKFLNYVKQYDQNDSQIKLKTNHTLRVMNLCTQIATRLNLSQEEIDLATLCGLLHDIARFEQIKVYQTYNDYTSIDHGDLGVEILKKNNFIREFNKKDEDDELIYTAIRYHNKYAIPNDLTDREKLFCNIIRDADKIDNFYLEVKGEIKIDLANTKFSDKVYKTLIDKKLVLLADKNTKADTAAIILGFYFDLALIPSFEIVKENDYLNKQIDIYLSNANNNDLREQLIELRKIMNDYIDRRCKNVR